MDGVATRNYLWLGIRAAPQTILRRRDIIGMAAGCRENVIVSKRSQTTFLYAASRQGNVVEKKGKPLLTTSGYFVTGRMTLTAEHGEDIQGTGGVTGIRSGAASDCAKILDIGTHWL